MNQASSDGGKKYLQVFMCRDPTQQWVESLQTLISFWIINYLNICVGFFYFPEKVLISERFDRRQLQYEEMPRSGLGFV